MKVARLGLVAILAVTLGGLALAVDRTYDVRFVDEHGSLITDANVWVFTTGQKTHSRHLGDPTGVYQIKGVPGDKLNVELQITGANTAGFVLPADEGSFDVVVAPREIPPPALQPPNDLCVDAIGPLAVPSLTAGTTIGATFDFPPPCDAPEFAEGVWYTVIGTGNTMTLTTCENQDPPGSATYDTIINVYTGADCDNLVCFGGNDDELGCSFHSTFTFCSVFGETYYIHINGFFANGNFELSVFDDGVGCATGACCNCNAPPFNCTEVRLADCDAMGALYQGDYVECFPTLGVYQKYPSAPNLPFGFFPNIISDTINITDSYIIGDVNIELEIFHTWIGDLSIDVEHNTVVNNIWDNRCGGTVGIFSTADDSGTETMCAGLAAGPADQNFYSEPIASQPPDLDVYEGMDVMGDWTLTIEDTFAYLDDGTLLAWAVSVDQQGPPACPDQNNSSCFLCGAGGTDTDTDDEDSDSDSDDSQSDFDKDAGRELGFGAR